MPLVSAPANQACYANGRRGRALAAQLGSAYAKVNALRRGVLKLFGLLGMKQSPRFDVAIRGGFTAYSRRGRGHKDCPYTGYDLVCRLSCCYVGENRGENLSS